MTAQPLIVFDWDGTLVDSTDAIAHAIRQAAADLELPVPSLREASHVIGLGLRDALGSAVPTLTPQRYPEFVERYRHHYLSRDADLTPFDGIVDLLDALAAAGVEMAVATGKSRVGLNRALDQMGWHGRFVATRCADEGEPKPHPWMLLDLGVELDLDPQSMLMVGDTTHDLGMARAAGAYAIGVSYGAHPRDQLLTEQSLAIVDDVAELKAALLRRVLA